MHLPLVSALLATAIVVLPSCKSEKDAPKPTPKPAIAQPANTTVNQFLKAGTPAFVLGTQGDKKADHAIAAQVALARSIARMTMLVHDTTIKIEDPSTWPPNPVLYGASQFNGVLRDLSALPFEISENKLVIGGKSFTGPGYQLITVVPKQKDHPEFLLYAGTSNPGIAEINAVAHGPDPILIADAFGPLHRGRWIVDEEGTLTATLDPAARRIQWREVKTQGLSIYFPAELEAAANEAELVASIEQGLALTTKKLELASPAPISVYVSPDHASKKSLTGVGGDGHALPEFQTLHVVSAAPQALTQLVAHEATHLLAHAAFGQAGSALAAEGLAVWASGQYGGVPIADFTKQLDKPQKISDYLGGQFRVIPEKEAYMHAALAMQTAVGEIGVELVGQHLLGATNNTWEDECLKAGTTQSDIQSAYEKLFR